MALLHPPTRTAPSQTHRWQHAWMLPPLAIWISVSATLRYGYYGDSLILLGPVSSRLITTSSVFVKQLQVSTKDKNQVFIHTFNKKPQLSSQTNWTASDFFLVEPYKNKVISLWLNQGSTIRIRWEEHTTTGLDKLHGMVVKGDMKFEQLQNSQPTFLNAISLRETVNAKVYDTTKAKKMCSTENGPCRLSVFFPETHYIILTAADNGEGISYVEISLVARVFVYILLLGVIAIVVFLILKVLGVYDDAEQHSHVTIDVTYRTSNVVATHTETEPLMRVEENRMSYGTNAKDDEQNSGTYSSSSSEELYDEKLCCICYDEQRNSFFVPCGHCATCYDCAQRIVDGESKVCPICRRLIHKMLQYKLQTKPPKSKLYV
ncbi:uncharacterized protein LOC114162616 isoform X4 [Vigna unguiculata]|uniref:uncharacterized protein LOC114162616 isoform X4 n=1 Tax=Vigna unguiculata TaxID=3917 RepID=UPI001016FD9C|nr:uncharacterized protein LOC114162616 isoform X4 [Vigna unguiculata]